MEILGAMNSREDALANLGARVVQAASLAVAMHLREALEAFSSDPDVMEFLTLRQRVGGADPDARTRKLSGAIAARFTEESLSDAEGEAE